MEELGTVNGIATWQGKAIMTSKGPCTATQKATNVQGVPQGKMRSSVATSRSGAMSVKEPLRSGARSVRVLGPSLALRGRSTVVGGAPQGKIRASVPASRPGAMSGMGPTTSAQPLTSTGVIGAPQGKMRRASIPDSRSGAMGVVEPVTDRPSAAAGVGAAPQGKMRASVAPSGQGAMWVPAPTAAQPSAATGASAIDRKEIPEIMKESGLSQREKQSKIQQLMADGMPKPSVSPKAIAPVLSPPPTLTIRKRLGGPVWDFGPTEQPFSVEVAMSTDAADTSREAAQGSGFVESPSARNNEGDNNGADGGISSDLPWAADNDAKEPVDALTEKTPCDRSEQSDDNFIEEKKQAIRSMLSSRVA